MPGGDLTLYLMFVWFIFGLMFGLGFAISGAIITLIANLILSARKPGTNAP